MSTEKETPSSKERVTQIMDTIRRVAREQKSYRENTIRDLEDGANLLARLSVETTGVKSPLDWMECPVSKKPCNCRGICKLVAVEPTVTQCERHSADGTPINRHSRCTCPPPKKAAPTRATSKAGCDCHEITNGLGGVSQVWCATHWLERQS